MILTALSFLLIAALAVVALGVLLLPVYLWAQHRDAMLAPQRAAERLTMERLGRGGEPPGLRAARAVLDGLAAPLPGR